MDQYIKSLKKMEKFILEKVTEKKIIKNKIKEIEKEIVDTECKINYGIEARAIMKKIAQETQKNIEEQFNKLVTSCLKSVFSKDINFKISFIERRNKTECDLFIEENGQIGDVFDSSGGGVADICCLGCRVAFLTLEKDKRKIIFLDEPLKFLHSDTAQQNCGDMLKMLSEKFGIQFIIISDQNCLIGDKNFEVINGKVYGDKKKRQI